MCKGLFDIDFSSSLSLVDVWFFDYYCLAECGGCGFSLVEEGEDPGFAPRGKSQED